MEHMKSIADLRRLFLGTYVELEYGDGRKGTKGAENYSGEVLYCII